MIVSILSFGLRFLHNNSFARYTASKSLFEFKKPVSEKTYIAIDLKSFYASVECMERSLPPLTTLLVVADKTRTSKTICLAVSPALKALGIGGRPRLFEVEALVKKVNARRQAKLADRKLDGASTDALELKSHPEKAVDFVIAPPQMAHYISVSTTIYEIYLKFIAPEDIHVYSIDEVFIEATAYLKTYQTTAYNLAERMIHAVLDATGITATAGIGSNLYLAKVAMDIVAKHIPADDKGVRIAKLTEKSYREKLWTHEPLTDFWRVGKGYAEKLKGLGIRTMGDIARCSLGKPNDRLNEETLFRLFGINAELLIDHAWGYEPCTIAQIKAYEPENHSLGSGQVLQEAYPFEKALLVAKEMADALSLSLVEKCVVTDQITLTVGYDIENLTDPKRKGAYFGSVTTDAYGRKTPKAAHGTFRLPFATSSSMEIMVGVEKLFRRIVNPALTVRRITIAACNIVNPDALSHLPVQQELFSQTPVEKLNTRQQEKERKVQQAMLSIKKRFGKNAIVRGMNLVDGATARQRNTQIGGHKA